MLEIDHHNTNQESTVLGDPAALSEEDLSPQNQVKEYLPQSTTVKDLVHLGVLATGLHLLSSVPGHL